MRKVKERGRLGTIEKEKEKSGRARKKGSKVCAISSPRKIMYMG